MMTATMSPVKIISINTTWITIILWMLLFMHVAQGACPDNKFGDNCSLVCHCEVGRNCQTDGTCDTGCDPSWDGPTCQIKLENVALQGSTSAHPRTKNDTLTAEKAVDGITDQTVMGTWVQGTKDEETAYWYVDTGAMDKVFRRIQIWFYDTKTDAATNVMRRRRGYSVQISNSSDPNSGHVCYQDDTSVNETNAVKTLPDCRVAGRYVFLYNVRNNETSAAELNLSNQPNLELVEVQAWADSGCSEGTFGDNCEKLCSEYCSNKSCDRNSGACADGCKAGRFLENCTQKCPVNCDGMCSRTTGYCQKCLPGYYGNQCNQNCSKNCQDVTCELVSGKCDSDCKTGFHGDFCNLTCDANCESNSGCNKGTGECFSCASDQKYDTFCDKDCPSNCKDDVCHKNGSCVVGCDDGFIGTECQNSCSKQIQNCLKCEVSAIGDTDCSSCSNATYGVNCSNKCPTNCLICESDSSCSKCKQGYTGDTCLDVCNVNRCEECNKDNECLVCEPGFYGTDCNSNCSNCYRCHNETYCTECSTGQYLMDRKTSSKVICLNCNVHCVACSSKDLCTECKPGFHGATCQDQCPAHCLECESNTNCTGCENGWSGSYCHCSDSCSKNGGIDEWCDANIGECSLGCVDGYTGSSCQDLCDSKRRCAKCDQKTGKCEECTDGMYNLIESCNKDCGNCKGKICNDDGTCSGECEHGFHGNSCNMSCPTNCAGHLCLKLDGTCSDDCNVGFTGSKCEQKCGVFCHEGCDKDTGKCGLCKSGHFGEMFCEADCPANCGQDPDSNKEVCNRISGECMYCKQRYFGENCTQLCSNNCVVGPDGEICMKASGDCHACRPGFFGTNCNEDCGINCLDGICDKMSGDCKKCEHGFFGDKCTEDCSENCLNGMCRKSTGDCDQGCSSGWYNVTCDVPCGDRCGGGLCDQATGNCSLGCKIGFQGQFCQEAIQKDEPESSIILPIIITLVIVLVIVAAIIAVLFYRRKKGSQYSQRRSNGYHGDLRLQPLSAERQPLVYANANGNGVTGINQLPVPARNRKVVSVLEEELVGVDETAPLVSNTDPSDYYNLSSRITVETFSEYLQERRAENMDWYRQDFQKLPRGLLKNCQMATLPSNLVRCRYKQLYPYDHTRVKLDPEPNFKHDFINASYIGGYKKPEAFIAAQGPTDVNVNDFWRMIFQKDCGKIVMLTNLFEELKMKCVCYWPEKGTTETFGNYDVTVATESVFPDYTVRQLNVINNTSGEAKDFKHFHFTAWPDRGVPDNPSCMLNFRDKVMEEDSMLPAGPILVHCSAGIGRTGTFIALDYLIRQAQEEHHIDVFRTITDMRYQRTSFVQTDIQYEFLHEALAEALTTQVMEVSAEEFCTHYWSLLEENPETGKTKLQEQFDVVNKMTPTLDPSAFQSGGNEENIPKNRDQSIVPVDRFRAYLSTPVNDSNEYINGVFLPTCSNKTAFIITQMPVPYTVIDFWRLVFDQHATTIIMMNNEHDNDETYGEYWPSDDRTFGPFQVELFSCENNDHFSILSFQLTYTSQSRQSKMMIRQYRFEGWSDNETVPSSTSSLTALISAVTQLRQDQPDKPTIVHCMDGAERSGLFCVVSAILERLQMNQSVNIPQIILQLRGRRPQLIQSMDQFDFCYRAVADYLSANQIYSNVP